MNEKSRMLDAENRGNSIVSPRSEGEKKIWNRKSGAQVVVELAPRHSTYLCASLMVAAGWCEDCVATILTMIAA